MNDIGNIDALQANADWPKILTPEPALTPPARRAPLLTPEEAARFEELGLSAGEDVTGEARDARGRWTAGAQHTQESLERLSRGEIHDMLHDAVGGMYHGKSKKQLIKLVLKQQEEDAEDMEDYDNEE